MNSPRVHAHPILEHRDLSKSLRIKMSLVPYRGRGGQLSVPSGSGKVATAVMAAQLLANYPDAVSAVARSVYNGGQYVMQRIGRKGKTSSKTPANNIVRVPSAPLAVDYQFKPRPPRIMRGGDGSMIVTHSEVLGRTPTGGTTGAFNLTSFLLNPVNSTAFPWLSTVAGGFLTYAFSSLSFTIIPSVPTTTSGNVYMAMGYDVSASQVVSSREEMSQFKPADGRVWDKLTLRADPKRLNLRTNYVRADAENPQVMSQCGRLMVASQYTNQTFASGMGDIVVTYKIKLSTPVGTSTGFLGFKSQGTVGVSAGAPFGSIPITTGDASLTFDTATGTNRLLLPFVGSYYLFFENTGTGLTTGTTLGTQLSLTPVSGAWTVPSGNNVSTTTDVRTFHLVVVTDAPVVVNTVMSNLGAGVLTSSTVRGFESTSTVPVFTATSASMVLSQAKLTLDCQTISKEARHTALRSQLVAAAQDRLDLAEATEGLDLADDDFRHLVGPPRQRPPLGAAVYSHHGKAK